MSKKTYYLHKINFDCRSQGQFGSLEVEPYIMKASSGEEVIIQTTQSNYEKKQCVYSENKWHAT